jgi:hypothetical protein
MTRLLVVLAAALAPAAHAGLTFGVKAGLDARQQVPPPRVRAAAAVGTLSGTLAVTGRDGTLRWRLDVAGLTGPPRGAELRRGRLGRRGPRLATLCRPCRDGARGATHLSASAILAIRNGAAYVVVATRENPAGEIRGQLRVLTGA